MKLLLLTSSFIISYHFLSFRDTIIVRKDPRLDILSAKQAEINKRTSMLTSSGLYKGYRIQIISTTNRDQAIKAKADVMARVPNEKGYLTYNSPYFKVRIGNFIKREDADKLRTQLNKYYPQGIYVVEDAVEYTLKDADNNGQ